MSDRRCADTGGSEAVHWRPHSEAEIDAAQGSTSGRGSPLPSGLSNTFTNFVTQTYARSSLAISAPPTSQSLGLGSMLAMLDLLAR